MLLWISGRVSKSRIGSCYFKNRKDHPGNLSSFYAYNRGLDIPCRIAGWGRVVEPMVVGLMAVGLMNPDRMWPSVQWSYPVRPCQAIRPCIAGNNRFQRLVYLSSLMFRCNWDISWLMIYHEDNTKGSDTQLIGCCSCSFCIRWIWICFIDIKNIDTSIM